MGLDAEIVANSLAEIAERQPFAQPDAIINNGDGHMGRTQHSSSARARRTITTDFDISGIKIRHAGFGSCRSHPALGSGSYVHQSDIAYAFLFSRVASHHRQVPGRVTRGLGKAVVIPESAAILDGASDNQQQNGQHERELQRRRTALRSCSPFNCIFDHIFLLSDKVEWPVTTPPREPGRRIPRISTLTQWPSVA